MKKLLVLAVFFGAAISFTPQKLYAGWILTYGGTTDDGGQAVCETTDGGFAVTGQIGDSLLLLKANSTGEIVWNHSYADMMGTCIREISGGDFIITGSKDDRWLGLTLLVMKTYSSGDTAWAKTHGQEGCEGNSILPIGDGYLITGTNGELWIIKTDLDGELLWEKSYGESGRGYTIIEAQDGGYIVAGTIKLAEERDDLCIMKIDDNGDSLWLKTYGQTGDYEHAHSIEPTGDGGYFLGGQYGSDIWLLKTDSEGDTAWSKVDQTGRSYKLVGTSDGNYALAGMRYTGANKHDLLILKLDPSGNKIWQKTYGGSSDDIGNYIQQTADGGYIVAGQTRSYGEGGFDMWLVRTNLAGDTVAVSENSPGISDWNVITRVGSNVTLRYTENPQGFHAEVFDASGRKVDEIHSSQPSGSISWGEDQETGVYFIVPKGIEGIPRKVVLVR